MKSLLLGLLLYGASCSAADYLPATIKFENEIGTLQNGFASLQFSLFTGRITALKGDFKGSGDFSKAVNLVAPTGTLGVGVEVQLSPAAVTHSTSNWRRGLPIHASVLKNDSDCATVVLADLREQPNDPATSSNWTLSLCKDDRAIHFNSSTRVIRDAYFTSLRLSLYFQADAGYWIFDDGPFQMADHVLAPFFADDGVYSRFYALGENGAGGIDVISLNANSTRDTSLPYLPPLSLMYSGHWNSVKSGLLQQYAGNFDLREWKTGWQGAKNETPVLLHEGNVYQSAFKLYPNDMAFPVSSVPADYSLDTANIPADDIGAVLMGVFGSPTGSMVSHTFAPEGRITPCVYFPSGCYSTTYNYFDPDSFLSITAMTYAGDSYLFEQIRKLIDTSRGQLCMETEPHKCVIGQVPHHFVDSCFGDGCVCGSNRVIPTHPHDCVTFYALSGATQTGPNVFWILSSLQYAALSGDYDWLRSAMPDLRLALEFLLDFIDPDVGLLSVPGSLFIDTFIRQHYTTDSNAAMVLLLERFIDAESFVGNSTGVAALGKIRERIITQMNALLWDGTDHYITQRNPDNSTRDFVDYDSNLLAVMAGVAARVPGRAEATLKRVDSGPCTHARATYVSEIYYNQSNCNGGNTGDSAVTMGRIAWLDGRARRLMGTKDAGEMARDVILAPLQEELLANTWMYERYQCGGEPTHNAYYIEYPEVVAMLLMEVKYGVDITLNTISVTPFFDDIKSNGFKWRVGSTNIEYSSTRFAADLPLLSGSKAFTVTGMEEGTYTINTQAQPHLRAPTIHVGPSGVLKFQAQVGKGHSFEVVKQ